MTADILSLLQAYTDPQAFGQITADTSQVNPDAQAGVFAALMDEYTSLTAADNDAEIMAQVLFPEQEVITLTSGNAFIRPVIDLLSGETAEPENVPASQEISNDYSVIWPEDESAPETNNADSELGRIVNKLVGRIKSAATEDLQPQDIEDIAENVIADEGINNLPEAVVHELACAVNDAASALKHNDSRETQNAVKILGAVAERIAPKVEGVSRKDEDEEDPDHEPDIDSRLLESFSDLSGVTVITNFTPQNVQDYSAPHESESSQPQALQHTSLRPHHVRTNQPEPQTQTQTPEVRENTQSFREVFMNRETFSESGQDQPGSQSQGFSQRQGEPEARDSSTRSRTNTRRTAARTQNDDIPASSGTSTRRTDSRSDFAAYFEGVLTSRRTSSRTQAAPLDLRNTENFTQSSGVRDGITNVVRFIRADGVQKARVIVDPPALGRISVELTSGTSGVEASIKVSSEQIRQLIQDQLSELRMNLSQQGVQVAEFTVDVQQDNSGSHNQQGQQQNNPYMNFLDDADDDITEAEEFRIDLEDGLLYWVA